MSLKRDLRNYFETSCLDTKTEVELDGGGCGSLLVNVFLWIILSLIDRYISKYKYENKLCFIPFLGGNVTLSCLDICAWRFTKWINYEKWKDILIKVKHDTLHWGVHYWFQNFDSLLPLWILPKNDFQKIILFCPTMTFG